MCVKHGNHYISFGWSEDLRSFFASVREGQSNYPELPPFEISGHEEKYIELDGFVAALQEGLSGLALTDFEMPEFYQIALLSDRYDIGMVATPMPDPDDLPF